jgi:hypothetical protein
MQLAPTTHPLEVESSSLVPVFAPAVLSHSAFALSEVGGASFDESMSLSEGQSSQHARDVGRLGEY